MSEYRRFVSYLYTYSNGIKTHNVGFAKTECRDGMIRLIVNVRDNFIPNEDVRVYFYVRREDRIAGIEMGSLGIKGCTGEYRGLCATETIGVPFGELCGIYIAGNGTDRLYVSQWDDETFEADKILPLKDVMQPENDVSESDVQEDEAFGNVVSGSDVQEDDASYGTTSDEYAANNVVRSGVSYNLSEDGYGNVEPEENEAANNLSGGVEHKEYETPIWERPIRKEIYITGNRFNTQSDGTEERDAEVQDAQTRDTKICDEAMYYDETCAAQNTTDRYFDGREPVLVFSDDEIYDCIDIGLDDLDKLPDGVAKLKNNSFVNHSYYSFRHLLLGKKDGGILVVGVPGIYNRREKMTAEMFGFDKFKFSMRSDVRASHFGYWYKEYKG